MVRISQTVLPLAAALLLSGCVTAGKQTEHLPEAKYPPKEVWAKYGDYMRKNDFAKSYHLLTSDSKKRYPYMDYYLMFTQTRFGALIRHLFVAWTIVDVAYAPDRKHATVVFQHDIFPEYHKKFDMTLEEGEWKIRITLAGCLEMPEWDERTLFPETFGEELTETEKGAVPESAPQTERERLREGRRGR